jgi:competence protein ComEA
MFVHVPPKERAVYVVLISIFLFGAGYVGAQRLRSTPKIEIDIPKGGKDPFSLSPGFVGQAASPETPSGSELVVHVVGAVKSPGLEHLPPGSRIDDAVKAAGGATKQANLEAINLAAKLEDGQQVFVPKQGAGDPSADALTQSAKAGRVGGKHPDHPIDLSSSSFAQLEELPGVGQSMAEKLMEYRLQHGHLSFNDLRAIPGLGPKKLAKLKPWVR